MNYKESVKILEEIKKADKILINCHRSPDPDCVGSALALFEVFKKMGKETKIIGPNEIGEEYKYLQQFKTIQRVDFNEFDFGKWDLFVLLDSSRWELAIDTKNYKKPPIKTVVIDHHATNIRFGDINLIDKKISSCAEMIYLILNDWKVDITPEIAKCILTGIIGDTGTFEYPNTTPRTFEIVKSLMEKGADKDEIVINLNRSYSLNILQLWGEILRNIHIEEKDRFVWAAIPYEIYKKFEKPSGTKESAANTFAPVVKDTDFGIVMVEEKRGLITISFRTRTGFDVSKIAQALGGGGHKQAAGARIYDLPFDEAVEKVLQTARKFARQK